MAVTLPVFPLGTVLLPGVTLPLHIFEPRYRRLTVELVTGEIPDKQFGIVAVREGHGADDGIDALHPVGCTAELQEARQLPDGRFDVVTRGVRRFRLLDLDDTRKPYLVGTVEFLPDLDEPDADLTPHGAAARAAYRRYCTAAWRPGEWTEPADDTTATSLPGLLAADCLLALDDRQLLLEQPSTRSRLRLIRALLHREAALVARLGAVPVPLAGYAVAHSDN